MSQADRSTSMHVSLPQTLRSFVEEQVAASAYSSASEYVRELIRRERDRRLAAQKSLEELLLEGLASPASEWTEADWSLVRERVRRRLEREDESR